VAVDHAERLAGLAILAGGFGADAVGPFPAVAT